MLLVILKKKKYLFIALLSALIIGSVSYYLTVVSVLNKSILIYADMNGGLFTITTLFLSAAIAILIGGYMSLMIFRRDIIQARANSDKATSFTGVITGIVASGCPSCGVPLLGLIGFPLALYSLPFKGLEIKVLSILFLGVAIYLIQKNIRENLLGTCSVKNDLI